MIGFMPSTLKTRKERVSTLVVIVRRVLTLCVFHAVLASCAAVPASPKAPIPPPAIASLPNAIEERSPSSIPDVVAAERDASADGDLATLAALWAADARIVDGRGTVDTEDDYVWQGHDAIMDRYVLAVLPVPPLPLDPSQLAEMIVEIDQDTAYAILGIDRWTLRWQDGRWWLTELRYN